MSWPTPMDAHLGAGQAVSATLSPLLPAEPAWWDAAGPLVLLALIAAWLVWLTRRLGRHLDVATSRIGGVTAGRIVGVAVGVHVAVALAVGTVITADAELLAYAAPDAIGYQRTVDGLIAAPLDGPDPPRWADRGVYLYLAAFVQAVFGGRGLAIVVVNAALLGTSLLLLVDITRQLAGSRTAAVAAVLLAALPAIYLWAATPLREALVLCLTVWCVQSGVRAVAVSEDDAGEGRAGGLPWLLAAAVPLVLMNWTREAQVPALAAVVVVAGLLQFEVRSAMSRWLARRWVLVAGSATLAAAVLALGPRLTRLAWRVSDRAAHHSTELTEEATTRVAMFSHSRFLEPVELLVELPAGVIRFLFAPMPWQQPDGPVLLWLDAAVWVAVAVPVVAGLWLAVRARRRAALVPLAAALVTAAIGAVTLGNYGIISRIRLHSWVLLVPFAAWALSAAVGRISVRRGTDSGERTGSAVSPRARPRARGR